ncbi:HNH endonuclease [Sulfurovum sp.]|uniref:HNH endonuclease n=1 Tax=Sulfurovum sp. TaxID=1969726 RepID=UPI0028683350|nr:HNH endonuclease [Sulfurovum sp.]
MKLKKKIKKTGRDPSLRLRYKVLLRDSFTCKQCGASPAKDQNVELHIDHISPWSKNGETTLENLQTLCSSCNLGKSNL